LNLPAGRLATLVDRQLDGQPTLSQHVRKEMIKATAKGHVYIYIYIHFIYKHYIHTGSQKQPKAATQNNTNTNQQIYPQNQKVEYRLKVDCIQKKLNIQVFLNVQLFKKRMFKEKRM
jgi:hypothetical protein